MFGFIVEMVMENPHVFSKYALNTGADAASINIYMSHEKEQFSNQHEK